MIPEAYVSFETAKLLKEHGFDEPCSHLYTQEGRHDFCGYARLTELTNTQIEKPDDWVSKVYVCTCPTQQVATRWLREKHYLMVQPYLTSIGWYFEVLDLRHPDITGCAYMYQVGIPNKDLVYKTYEEACEAGISHCLQCCMPFPEAEEK